MNYAAWGVSWLGSWGQSWGPLHEVDEGRRPKTNIRLRQIRDVVGSASGAEARFETGVIVGRTLSAPVTVVPVWARGMVVGADVACRSALIAGKAGGRLKLVGRISSLSSGRVAGRGRCNGKLLGREVTTLSSAVSPFAGARGSLSWDEDVESFIGEVGGRGVLNPSDEELAYIAACLLKLAA